jgi:hypothetical protein
MDIFNVYCNAMKLQPQQTLGLRAKTVRRLKYEELVFFVGKHLYILFVK